jgi:hypothetical protein
MASGLGLALQGQQTAVGEMTWAMVIGGGVLVGTQVLLVVAAVVWYMKADRRNREDADATRS